MGVIQELDRENFLSKEDAKKMAPTERLVAEIKGINVLLPLWENQTFKVFLDLLKEERMALIKQMENAPSEYHQTRASGASNALAKILEMNTILRDRKRALEVQLSNTENGDADEE